ncbi:MAG: primosomal protein N' [Candidatus Cloacimonetes bacterium]|nr:primosomal protein N' [Candidatus Cloacimonadota bacterium]
MADKISCQDTIYSHSSVSQPPLMFYYDVVLPLALKNTLTYSSATKLATGIRVMVTLRNAHYTGIVWCQAATVDPAIKYLPILDIIDKNPILPATILQLAEWVHKYYHVPLGQSLFAMLPHALDVNIQVEVRKKENAPPVEDPEQSRLLTLLDCEIWMPVLSLKDKLPAPGFYALLETMECSGFLEIKRTFDSKIKKKTLNFVIKLPGQNLPDLTEKQIALYEFISEHGSEVALAEIAKTFSYALVKALRQKSLITIQSREITPDDNLFPTERILPNITPNAEQIVAVNTINSALDNEKFQTLLLYGITGSGKTEVYIRSIHNCLARGKSALMLVPEISLTPQMVERFYNAFGEDIAILHSRLNDRQRWQQWLSIRENRSRIVIGARSAVFAPLANIGIIIVDEEHENSYKQENTPRYNARDLAVVRARNENAVIVLGSATPSLESWYNAQSGKYKLLQLNQRPGNFQLPDVEIVDMCQEKDREGLFSEKLIKLMDDRLARKQQIILFQNRRGHSSFIQCISCGALFKCRNCDISFNYHSHSENLLCHYCGISQPVPRKCPDCGSFFFRYGSPGTQQIEEQLKILFPSARILRMDSDSTSRADSYNIMFDRMKDGSIDILLGTQMITKGLDFPNVTLVGVISADVGLNFPDFRAGESTFQLLTQVAGRSGRGDIHGHVVIQSYNPSHYAITYATRQDFPAFAEIELKNREELHYAPFYRLARLIFTADDEKLLIKTLKEKENLFNYLQNAFKKKEFFLIGPAPAPLTRINKKFRYHLFLKAEKPLFIQKAVQYLSQNLKLPAGIQLTIDIDPVNML